MFQIMLSVAPHFDLGNVALRLTPSPRPNALRGQSVELKASRGVTAADVIVFGGLELFDFQLSVSMGAELQAELKATSASTAGGLYIQIISPLGDRSAVAIGHLRHTGLAKPILVCPDDSARKIDCPGVLHCKNLIISC